MVTQQTSNNNFTQNNFTILLLFAKQFIKLDGQGKARREAARRRNSECKINFNILLAAMAVGLQPYSER